MRSHARPALVPAVLFVLTLQAVAVPAPAAGWTQAGGGPGHPGVADVPFPLDIVRMLRLAPDGMTLLPRSQVLDANGTLLAVAAAGSGSSRTCVLAVTGLSAGALPPTKRGDPFACPERAASPDVPDRQLAGIGLVAYDAATDLALLCTEEEAVAAPLRAVRVADGVPAWSLPAPAVDAGTGAGPGGGGSGPSMPGAWSCGLPALRDGVAYVPFRSSQHHAVSAVRVADGTVLWSRSVSTPRSLGLALPEPAPTPVWAGFSPFSVTATTTGIVVLGHEVSPEDGFATYTPAFATFSFNGTLGVAMSYSAYSSIATALGWDAAYPVMAISTTAAALRNEAAFLFGRYVVLADPAIQDINFYHFAYNLPPTVPAASGVAVTPDDLVVPADFVAAVYHAGSNVGQPISYRGYRMHDVVLDGYGRGVFLAIINNGGNLLSPAILVHDLATLQPRQRLLPPIVQPGSYTDVVPPLHLAAISGGLLVWGDAGDAAVLGKSPLAPIDMAVSSEYPAVGEEVHITPTQGGSYLVSWGNLFEDASTGPFVRRYTEPGDQLVALTLLGENGTTSTAVRVLHVGTPPPVELTPLQQAFAAENQNITFFVLGLLVTAFGAIWAIAQRRRHRSRIQADLVVLDELEREWHADPEEARRDVADFERTLRERLARGRITDANFGILDRRIRDIRALDATRRAGRTGARR